MLFEFFTFLAKYFHRRADARLVRLIAKGTPLPNPDVIDEATMRERRGMIDLLAGHAKPSDAEVVGRGGTIFVAGQRIPSTVCFKDGSRIKVSIQERCTDKDLQRRHRAVSTASLIGASVLKCGLCEGSGETVGRRCPKCGGIGILVGWTSLNVSNFDPGHHFYFNSIKECIDNFNELMTKDI